ncbi:splicing factor YJU2-like [Lytechinus variegatus]|uniref:splicing factor YJU2-like n=1 Tax=Lytechinus variegatus TaxID=7654 RepID=UPI001BB100C2|nr:splicing factor YJU2-like [Lytechinus variegatus]
MSERKVLNKYYPPEFDPSKIPKLKLAKERQYTVRIMAPFNMQCKVCNEYIYKGKKFNAKTENVHNENYLGLRIYRFYIRCPRCISEVVFKTDPENTDYTLEQGATRLFEAAKLYQAAEEEEKRQAEEDAQNPMKVLENRTKDSKNEMEVMENLEELRELNMRQSAINYEEILKQGAEQEALRLKQQEEDDEEEIRRLFGKGGDGMVIKRLDDDDSEDDESPSVAKLPSSSSSYKRPTDILTDESSGPSGAKRQKVGESSRSTTKSSRSFLSGLVKVKKSDRSNKADHGNTRTPSECKPEEVIGPASNQSDAAADAARLSVGGTAPTDTARSFTGGTRDIEKRTESSESQSKNSDHAMDSEEAESSFVSSIQEGLKKQKVESQKVAKEKSSGLSLLGGYDFSDSDISDSASDS